MSFGFVLRECAHVGITHGIDLGSISSRQAATWCPHGRCATYENLRFASCTAFDILTTIVPANA
jgi:hypothetical protein